MHHRGAPRGCFLEACPSFVEPCSAAPSQQARGTEPEHGRSAQLEDRHLVVLERTLAGVAALRARSRQRGPRGQGKGVLGRGGGGLGVHGRRAPAGLEHGHAPSARVPPQGVDRRSTPAGRLAPAAHRGRPALDSRPSCPRSRRCFLCCECLPEPRRAAQYPRERQFSVVPVSQGPRPSGRVAFAEGETTRQTADPRCSLGEHLLAVALDEGRPLLLRAVAVA